MSELECVQNLRAAGKRNLGDQVRKIVCLVSRVHSTDFEYLWEAFASADTFMCALAADVLHILMFSLPFSRSNGPLTLSHDGHSRMLLTRTLSTCSLSLT